MSTETELVPAGQKTVSALAIFIERRTLVMLALGFSAGLPYLPDLRHAVGLAARFGPLARSDRLLQPGHAGLDLQIPLGAVRRPRASTRSQRLARASPFVDAGLPGRDHARTMASGGDRSVPRPRNRRGLCGSRRLFVRHPGHRHRRVAHRSRGHFQAGRHGGRLSMGLSRGDDRGGRGAAAARRSLWLESFLRRDGGADDRWRPGGAGGAARGAPCRSARSMPKAFSPRPRGRRWNGPSASQSSQPARLFWARVSPPMPACLRAY